MLAARDECRHFYARLHEPGYRAWVKAQAPTLLEITGPLEDGLDWWLALAVTAAGSVLIGLSWAAVGGACGIGEPATSWAFRWTLHKAVCAVGGTAFFAAAVLNATWLFLAAIDFFGTVYMFCPLFYTLAFFTISIMFYLDICLSEI